MPTPNPRLSVVLPPSLAVTLAELARATDQSVSSIVRDLLLQTEPALRRMLRLVLAANGARGQIGDGIGSSLLRAVADLERELERTTDGAIGYQDLVDKAEAVPVRRRAVSGKPGAPATGLPRVAASAQKARTPGPVTRGSGTGKTRRKAVRGGSV